MAFVKCLLVNIVDAGRDLNTQNNKICTKSYHNFDFNKQNDLDDFIPAH